MLDGDGGIAEPKKYCPVLQFQKGWFFSQESCLLIESKDIFCSSRRAEAIFPLPSKGCCKGYLVSIAPMVLFYKNFCFFYS